MPASKIPVIPSDFVASEQIGIDPPLPDGLTESTDAPFFNDVRNLQISVSGADNAGTPS